MSLPTFVVAMAFSITGAKIFAKDVERALLGRGLAFFLDPSMLWVCAQRLVSGMFRGSTGRTASSFSSSSRRNPSLLQRQWSLSPFVPAETLRACALIGLHLMAAESASGSSGSQSPDLGDVWRNGCWALEVVGQDWPSEVVALFLEDLEHGQVALSCHVAMDFLCQETRDACRNSSESLGSPCSLCSQCLEDSLAEEWEGRQMQEWQPGKAHCHSMRKPFSHQGQAVTQRRGVR